MIQCSLYIGLCCVRCLVWLLYLLLLYDLVALLCFLICCFFFFKQKTAYEMRISDWSSDVCSSDLVWSSGMADMRMNRHVPIYSQSRPILREIDSGGYGFAVMQPLFLANGMGRIRRR